jgi:peptidoglycan/LPS O-acetylase OafA/YrhL
VFLAVAQSFAGRANVAAIPRTIYVILIATALGYGVWHLFEAPARSWIRSLPQRIGRKSPGIADGLGRGGDLGS